MNRTRTALRAAVGTTVLAGALALATPAFAHVEVKADNAQALATNVTLDFSAEAESTTAGITSVRVVLPAGIAPADVALAEGPAGWKLTPGEDGYTLAGPALATGKDLDYKITVKQLPDAKELAFKTLESYSDNHTDRWIEIPENGAKPDKPAPVLALKPAAPGATPLAPSTAPSTAPTTAPTTPAAPATATATPSVAATTSAAAPAPAPTTTAPAQAAAKSSDDNSSTTPIVVGVVAVLALAAGGALWWRRRNTGN
ncbi:DUF1775 domain-containing protein [Kitasatospora sp. NPDC097643]|uniref:DUF1775 domain-containing protein n=1 Tax=Kitasatospora sp. NPDC097643 TaxID=3157230 RepID=UPI00331777B5